MSNTPTNGPDLLTGDNLANTIDALAGNDTVHGLLGNDQLTGGRGDDQLFGDDDNDVLIGGAGGDLLDGGTGSFDAADYGSAVRHVVLDLVITDAQNTRGAGLDTLVNIEELFGSNFNDVLSGDGGNNQLAGAGGDDRLAGRGGFDHLFGAQGNDTLLGGAASDQLSGGDGDDVLNGGAGGDVAEYFGASTGVVVDLAISGPQNTVGAGIDTLISIASVSGSNLDDTLEGNGQSNQLLGQDGNDNLAARGGDDQLNGNQGIDTMDGGAGDDVLFGNQAKDILTGGLGADTFLYSDTSDSNRATGIDQILDFNRGEGDVVDLHFVTGGTGVFIGNNEFSGTAGEVRVFGAAGNQTIQVDLNGDRDADTAIRVAASAILIAGDLLI